jgi:hypothetical protein
MGIRKGGSLNAGSLALHNRNGNLTYFRRIMGENCILLQTLHHFPAEHIFEIVETLSTNPTIIIFGGISFMKHVGIVFNHKLRPTKFAMVMIPGRIF